VCRQVLVATLKHAKPYVECVQKKWMTFFGKNTRQKVYCLAPLVRERDSELSLRSLAGSAICTHTDEVGLFLKYFQNSTRQLQNICAHGKVWAGPLCQCLKLTSARVVSCTAS
jgi:hypothetical protein